jgi:hypothetical protein
VHNTRYIRGVAIAFLTKNRITLIVNNFTVRSFAYGYAGDGTRSNMKGETMSRKKEFVEKQEEALREAWRQYIVY